MPGTTPFAAIPYSKATDEIKGYPGEVSEPGAKVIDTFLEAHSATFKSYAGPQTLKSGEFAFQTASGQTFTLPAVGTANQLIWVFVGSGTPEAKVTTSGGAKIYGDFVNAAATIVLTANQHVCLFSDGTHWLIIAGEPKREQVYGGVVARTSGTEYEASASRPTYVIAECFKGTNSGELQMVVVVGGVEIASMRLDGSGTPSNPLMCIPFICPAGLKWKATVTASSGAPTLRSNYLSL